MRLSIERGLRFEVEAVKGIEIRNAQKFAESAARVVDRFAFNKGDSVAFTRFACQRQARFQGVVTQTFGDAAVAR